jgi:hypothetical protein
VEASAGCDPDVAGVSAAGLRVASRCEGLEALLGLVVLAGGLAAWAKHVAAPNMPTTAAVTVIGVNFM